MSSQNDRLTAVEESLGYRFDRRELLDAALTHRSYANERGLEANYERLEFLGDAVLGMVTAEWLFKRYPDLAEGELSKLKSQLVSARTLAKHAHRLGLGESLLLGVGEARSGGRTKPSLLADAVEAVFGAVLLDGGLAEARAAILRLLADAIQEGEGLGRVDSKTRLQERVQSKGWDLPVYRVTREEGPDHEKSFTVDCLIQGRLRGRGTGRTKKAAEQAAAAQALDEVTGEA